MSAREKIMAMFPAFPVTGARVADEILADHARELADVIRAEASHFLTFKALDGADWAANLIDPDEEE